MGMRWALHLTERFEAGGFLVTPTGPYWSIMSDDPEVYRLLPYYRQEVSFPSRVQAVLADARVSFYSSIR